MSLSSSSSSSSSTYLQNTDELRKIFNKFDANSDGKISTAELDDILKSLGTTTSSPDDLRRVMDDLDTDHDGFISFDEFVSFCKSTAPADSTHGGDDELKDAFDLYDQDKSGLISANELHLVLTKLKMPCSIEDCVRMIKSVDSDGDGSVSFEEFKIMMKGGGGGGGGLGSKPNGAA